MGASRVTRGRLASTQGCHRCPCPSPWPRPTVRRAWWAVAAPFACPPAHRGGHRPQQQRQRSSATLPKKRRTQEKPAEDRCRRCRAVAVRLPVLLSAVRLLLRSCGVSQPPLPGAAAAVRLPVLPRCAAPRSRAAAVSPRWLPWRCGPPPQGATVGCRCRPCRPCPAAARWLPGSALLLAVAAVGCQALLLQHTRQREQRAPPDLSEREVSLESLQQSVASVAGPGRGRGFVGAAVACPVRRRSPGSAAVAVLGSLRLRAVAAAVAAVAVWWRGAVSAPLSACSS